MRLFKFSFITVILLILTICGAGYYTTTKIVETINEQYSGKKIAINGENTHFVTFKEVSTSGFPLKIGSNIIELALIDVEEESPESKIIYKQPIKIGYNLLSRKLFAEYSGIINSYYKESKKGNINSRVDVQNYKITVNLPLSFQLFEDLKGNSDLGKIVNHVGEIKVSANNSKTFDSTADKKLFDKDYEKVTFNFTPQKKYESLKDLLNNIPQNYQIDYVVKNNLLTSEVKNIPISMFYIFSALPTGIDISANTIIKTSANKLLELKDALDVSSRISLKSAFFSAENCNFKYGSGSNMSLDSAADLHLKKGFFDMMFGRYHKIKPRILAMSSGSSIDKEIQYFIDNKKDFRVEDLEDRNYRLRLSLNGHSKKNTKIINISDLSVFSEDSGFKMQSEIKNGKNQKNDSTRMSGNLFIQNYPAVVDFTSGYAYRLGKLKHLSKDTRDLYIKVNTEFLKKISEYPESKSNDLIINYSLDSSALYRAEIGNARLDQAANMYKNILYTNLVAKVGVSGDVAEKIKKIIPDINFNDPRLMKILPKLSSGNGEISKSDLKNKVIPKAIKNELNKLIKKKNLGNELFKSLAK